MASPETRCAALIAAAGLVGPSIPPAVVANRPHEAATALTRMADLLLPWLDGPPAPPDSTQESGPEPP